MGFKMHKMLAFALVIAIFNLPYVYYEILRPVVFMGVGILLFNNWEKIEFKVKLILIWIIVLFNPMMPLAFSKSWWIILDASSAWIIYRTFNTEKT